MKEIVWIFGMSATGKETFLHEAIRPGSPLLKALGWEKSVIKICHASIKHIGQYDGDPLVNLRERMMQEVPDLVESADAVLIKWQIVDSVAQRPQRLQTLMPEARHRIIELRAPKNELVERIKRKSWWHNYGQENELIDSELKRVRKEIKHLKATFEITVIDSGADNYTLIDNTPALV